MNPNKPRPKIDGIFFPQETQNPKAGPSSNHGPVKLKEQAKGLKIARAWRILQRAPMGRQLLTSQEEATL